MDTKRKSDTGGFSSAERHGLAKLIAQLSPLRDQLSLDLLLCLLTIASEPGLSINELAERTESPQASASRYASVLLGRYQLQEGKTPKILIRQEVSADDPRRRALFLTSEGNRIVRAFFSSAHKGSEA